MSAPPKARIATSTAAGVERELRAQVRTDKRFDLSDLIRDRFAEINVEVRDTPQGVEWGFRQED